MSNEDDHQWKWNMQELHTWKWMFDMFRKDRRMHKLSKWKDLDNNNNNNNRNIDTCTDCGVGMWSNGGQSTTCFGISSESNVVVIIIEFQNSINTTAEEIANEIKRVTGVTVEVISVNKETFEVRIVDGGTTTTDVISLAKKIQDTMRNGNSELLRQINNIDIRVETLSSASTSTPTSFNDLFFFFFHQQQHQTLHTIINTFIITLLLVVSLNL